MTDEEQLLDLHETYLELNNDFDFERLPEIWSDDPENRFFNLTGHNYEGLASWLALWRHYRTRIRTTEPWRSYDRRVQIWGDVGVITCLRTCGVEWIGDETPPVDPFPTHIESRSTEVAVRREGTWKVVHVHYSGISDQPRPAGI